MQITGHKPTRQHPPTRPDEHEEPPQVEPVQPTDVFRPSAEKVEELRKITDRTTRTQAARNRVRPPVSAPPPPRRAESTTSMVKPAGPHQTTMGERKRPRQMDRSTYLANLKATFGGP